MVFAQSSAPTGWTQDAGDTANNRMLRVVSSSGGGVGGTHDPSVMNVVPSHTHSFSTGNVSADHAHYTTTGGNSANHTHGFTTGGISSNHNHNYGYPGWAAVGGGGSNMSVFAGANTNAVTGLENQNHTHSGNTGGESASHFHAGWSGGINSNHTHSGGTDNGSSQTNWQPRFINLIICSKN
jgi:hypothetical protein